MTPTDCSWTAKHDSTPWLSRSQVAELLSLHPHTVWKMTQDGRLPAVKCGRLLRYHRNDVRKALEVVGI